MISDKIKNMFEKAVLKQKQEKDAINQIPQDTQEKLVESNGWKYEDKQGFEAWWDSKHQRGTTLNNAVYECLNNTLDQFYKEAIKKRQQLILCNKCGEDIQEPNSKDYYGLINAEYSTGYYSKYLPDCTMFKFSLCEQCLSKMFEDFKNPPSIKFYL